MKTEIPESCKPRDRRLKVIGVWLCVLVSVVVLSLLPEINPVVESVPPFWSDLAHIPAYALLTLQTIFVVATRVRMSVGVLAAIVMLLTLFGGFIELIQPLTGRTANYMDTILNGFGASLAAWGYHLWVARRAAVAGEQTAKSIP